MTRVLAIVGATATGKSALALRLAEATGGEIVNADALQVYRGLDVGTAKPTLEERRRVRHHLIDILDPVEPYSAGEFARRGRAALEEIGSRRRPALVVGGSGLYLRALEGGLAALPPADLRQRAELEARLARGGLAALRAELEVLDPPTAQRLAPGDTQRTLRALEVALATGRPLSSWLAQPPPAEDARLSLRKVGLTLPRAVLYDRIGSRVEVMVAQGWIDEVRGLLASGLERGCPAFQAIGYSQWVRHLNGELELERAIREIQTATRRYAKRQETWFRREPSVEWRDPREIDSNLPALTRWLRG
jgi:tRNA dimethylallyltransferase